MFIKEFNELNKGDADIAGGKGASLGELTNAGIPVPPGFVVLTNVFDRFLEEVDLNIEIDSILHEVKHEEVHTVERASEAIQALILNAQMPEDISNEIMKAYEQLYSSIRVSPRAGKRDDPRKSAFFVAVRSSATAEDSSAAAWAGQLDSFLNTTEDNLLETVQKC